MDISYNGKKSPIFVEIEKNLLHHQLRQEKILKKKKKRYHILDISLFNSESTNSIPIHFQFRPFLMPLNILEGPQLDFPRLLTWMKR